MAMPGAAARSGLLPPAQCPCQPPPCRISFAVLGISSHTGTRWHPPTRHHLRLTPSNPPSSSSHTRPRSHPLRSASSTSWAATTRCACGGRGDTGRAGAGGWGRGLGQGGVLHTAPNTAHAHSRRPSPTSPAPPSPTPVVFGPGRMNPSRPPRFSYLFMNNNFPQFFLTNHQCDPPLLPPLLPSFP